MGIKLPNCTKILNDKFVGVVKCDVIPPKKLYIPILPDNSNGKLLFHLNEMKNKTCSSVELKYVLQNGYKIKIHSAFFTTLGLRGFFASSLVV